MRGNLESKETREDKETRDERLKRQSRQFAGERKQGACKEHVKENRHLGGLVDVGAEGHHVLVVAQVPHGVVHCLGRCIHVVLGGGAK